MIESFVLKIYFFSSLLHLQLLGAKSVLKQDHHSSLGWPGTHDETKAGLEFVAILLPPLLKG